MDGYTEVYSMLHDVDSLLSYDYEYLVDKYGKVLVDLVIQDLKTEDLDNAYRFEIKESDFDKNMGLSSCSIYRNDVKMIPCLDANKNLLLMKQIADIIKELEKIFVFLGCDNKILGNRKTPWIEDKIAYCLNNCSDSLILSRLKVLSIEYGSIKELILKGNLRLVLLIASKYKFDSGDSFLEIIQNGNIGLMRAIEKFDISKGTAFSTYAAIEIHRSIKYNFKNSKYPVELSHYYIYTYHSILKAINDLSIQLGRYPTYKEISDYINKSISSIQCIMSSYLSPLSIDELLEATDDSRLLEFAQDKTADIYDIVYNDFLKNELREMLEKNLTKKQFFVIMHNFGFYDREYGLTELASMLGVSVQNVAHIKKSALKRLKKRTNIMELAVD